MQSTFPSLVALVVQYHPLLVRYARRLIQNESVAERLVRECLQHYYTYFEQNPGANARKDLQKQVFRVCQYWRENHAAPHASTNHS